MGSKAVRPFIPRTPDSLYVWLKGSTAGREIVRKLITEDLEELCRRCQKEFKPNPRVLVVVRSLGRYPGAEVFHDRGVNLRVEELVATEDDTEGDLFAERLLLAQLPKGWSRWVGGLWARQSTSIAYTGQTVSQRIECLEVKRTLRELKEWRDEFYPKQ